MVVVVVVVNKHVPLLNIHASIRGYFPWLLRNRGYFLLNLMVLSRYTALPLLHFAGLCFVDCQF